MGKTFCMVKLSYLYVNLIAQIYYTKFVLIGFAVLYVCNLYDIILLTAPRCCCAGLARAGLGG
jgi:hypothetical protein